VFEFVCDHLIPGCTHEDRDEDRDKLQERALQHSREHHPEQHDRIYEALKSTGIVFIRPA
jgi:predicted small metal-binding protein